MTPEQKERLQFLAMEMRKVAQPVGPMHGWWDDIIDIEAFLAGRKTMLNKTAGEWIAEAEEKFTRAGRPLPAR